MKLTHLTRRSLRFALAQSVTVAEAIETIGYYCCTDATSVCGAATDDLIPGGTAAGSQTEALSAICEDASSYVGTAIYGTNTQDTCADQEAFVDAYYKSDITACSTATLSGMSTSETAYTRVLSADCCGGNAGACDVNDNTVCETTANYQDVTTPISGCTAGSSGCADNGHWMCSGLVPMLFTENTADDLNT